MSRVGVWCYESTGGISSMRLLHLVSNFQSGFWQETRNKVMQSLDGMMHLIDRKQ